jgi:cysteine desulfurase
VEHPSILNAQGRLAQVEVLRVDITGRVVLPAGVGGPTTDPSESGAQLLSVQLVNGETGVVQPLAEVVEFARRQRALVHSDAVQALGHLRLDFAGVGVDAMTLSAHKIGGPVGIGALVVRRSLDFRPYGFGGEQESKRRPGTVPVALAAGFAAAVRQATAELAAESERLRRLHDRLISHSRQAIPDVAANCSGECSPAIVNLTFAGLRADDLLLLLDRAQISCSVGSACTAGVHRPSPVLLAMGRTVAQASASLRFSFGWQTSEADIDALVDALMPAVDQARTARTAP